MKADADIGKRHNARGDALRMAGHAAEAIAACEQGLSVDPNNVSLHISLGNLLLTSRGETANAAASYSRVLALYPAHREARIRLAHALKLGHDYSEAGSILRALVADYPDDPIVLKEIGRLHFSQNDLDAALESFRGVVTLDPRDADAHHWLAAIEQLRGNRREALAHYRRTTELKPLLRIPAIKAPPDFSVLLLFSPGDANTPHETLIRAAAYDSYFLLLLPGARYDVEVLRSRAQVVFNLISDVDVGREILPEAEALVDQLGLPVVNHPRIIGRTERECVAAQLSGIPFCRVPRVFRSAAESLTERWDRFHLGLPALVRVVGTHGGETFEKADDLRAVEEFIVRHPGATFYLSEFVDYRSTDGFFRKYRFFFVDAEILPYHLAIDKEWKVHHVSTDMANQTWMRREEEAFLNDPASVFAPQQFTALRAICDIIGLDFFGIDCAIGPDGKLIVFEVNATMLVHRDTGLFSYKLPAVDRIKRCFDAMLKRMSVPVARHD
jgi:tetratricopeptide (TPR) repeat protein